MAMELTTDLNAVFHDGGLCSHLNTTVCDDFNEVNGGNFFESHDIFLVSSLTILSGIKVSSQPDWYGF